MKAENLDKTLFTGGESIAAMDYWKQKLSAVSRPFRLIDQTSTASSSGFSSCREKIEGRALTNLRKISKDKPINGYVVLLAAVTHLLAEYTANDTVIIKTPLLERTAAPDISEVTLILRVEQDSTVMDCLRAAKDAVALGYKYSNYPRALAPPTVPLLTNVAFSYPEIHGELYRADEFDFLLTLDGLAGEQYLNIEFRNTLFSGAFARRFTQEAIALLRYFHLLHTTVPDTFSAPGQEVAGPAENSGEAAAALRDQSAAPSQDGPAEWALATRQIEHLLRYAGGSGLLVDPTTESPSGLINFNGQERFTVIEPVAQQPFYEVSYAQRRLLIIDQLASERIAFSVPQAFLITGRLDVAALERAFQALVDRHEILRTTFALINGEPRQKVHVGVVFKVNRMVGGSEEEAKAIANKDAITPFDLSKGPLMRVYLVELAEGKHVCILNIHHIVSDAWSIQILFNELLILYRAFSENRESPLRPLGIQYKDYVYWQQEQLANHQEEHRQFFRKRFSRDIPVLNLPTDFARPPVKTSNGGLICCPLDEETSAGIRQLGLNHNASLFMVLTALVKTLLFRYTGQPYLIVGAPIAARTHPDLEDQIGLFVNLLVLDTDLEEGESFKSLLQKVRTATLALYEHQTYPFDCLIDDLQVTRQENRSPLFDVIVQLQNVRVRIETAQEGELDIQPLAVDYPVCKYDLNFTFDEGSTGIAMLIEYNRDLFHEKTVRQMGNNFAAIARAVIAEEKLLLTHLELVASQQEEEEQHAFLQKMYTV